MQSKSKMFLLCAAALLQAAVPAAAEPRHAIAMHGEPALPPDYPHFPYVNPEAPKGGRIDYAVRGTFDSLNPFIVQGDATRGLFDQQFGYNVFEALMARSRDEAFTLYPLIAESVEMDEERTFIEFHLDPAARFSDGQPVTPEDVVFSMELLRDRSRPLYRGWLGLVESMVITGERSVRFNLKPEADRETPLLIALLPILPRHATDADRFDRSTLTPMIASGPYTIETVRPGELIVLKRNPDYWAREHPSKIGFDNYDEIRINYYRDENAMFEAFKKGLVSLQVESDPGRWAQGYDFPAARDGRVVREAFESRLPSGMFGFVLNTRRPVFANRQVRQALVSLFDFEWANRNLFFDAYRRTGSHYDGSELSFSGHPASEAERKLLAPWPDAVLPEIMSGEWRPPVSDGTGRDRAFLRHGYDLLIAAGCTMSGGQMLGPDGTPLAFEILLNGRSGEAVAASFARTLERVGIRASIRVVEAAQYQQRLQTYDYDVILQSYYSSLSPGGEQIGRWSSQSAGIDGTYNFAGAADPALDATIDAMLRARDREDFIAAVRAQDRVLMSGAYVVPLYHRGESWVARWSKIRRPEQTPLYGPQFQTWWSEER